MNKKELKSMLKKQIEQNTIIEYLKNNFICITNCNKSDNYENDYSLPLLAKQKRIAILINKSKTLLIEIYKYPTAPQGYFITVNKFNTKGSQVEFDVFLDKKI